jgi:cell fate regulator YaaT (PSP1 superfamily)
MPNRRVGGHDEVVKPLSGHCVASEKDLEQVRLNREKEKKAYQICLEKIRQHKWI